MKKSKQSDSITTFLGEDTRIDGRLEFKGTIRLDGNIDGTIHSDGGTVVVGQNAKIRADILVDVAKIMGELHGTIKARKRIEVYPPAKVFGDIQAPVIAIEAGVVFQGNCEMKPLSRSNSVVKDVIPKFSVVPPKEAES